MVKGIQDARSVARQIFESTYDGVAKIEEYAKVKDEVTGLTYDEAVVTLDGQPCRLSFEKVQIADQTESAASVTQTTKLFISPDVMIKPGSKITVTQAGRTMAYSQSGVPAVYDTHQEVFLDLFKGWT